MRRLLLASTAILLFLALRPSVASAAWPNSPFVNLPVCTASNIQSETVIIPDGSGGAIVAWRDSRNGAPDIFAQHILSSGVVDPAWPANGRGVCTASGAQMDPDLVSDGAGGAIVTWLDQRGGIGDIYAQRVLASGSVDPAWPVNGRALCTEGSLQQRPAIASDGASGAIVCWEDFRPGGGTDLYAMRVLASGVVDPAWTVDGIAICTAAGSQEFPVTTADGSGGAVLAWHDSRSAIDNDVYAHKVRGNGTVDPGWPADGRALCTASGNQNLPDIIPDGSGGALVVWHDGRGAFPAAFASHVTSNGGLDGWPANGLAVNTSPGTSFPPKLTPDGAGGAIVAWTDQRAGNHDVYAHHVLASGIVDFAWPTNGRAMSTLASTQNTAVLTSDGAGGAIVVWNDDRFSSTDVLAHHVLSSGALDAAWPTDGRVVCQASGSANLGVVASDGEGGVIAAWVDSRSFSANDIYAQRVARFGYLGSPEADLVSVRDVLGDQGGKVKLSFTGSYLDPMPYSLIDQYWVLRSVPAAEAALRSARGATVFGLGEVGAEFVEGQLFEIPMAGGNYFWEYLASVPAAHLSNYSYTAATTIDSTGSSNPRTVFMLMARTSGGAMWWFSEPDSGYSVDNLAPAAPAPFTGQYLSGTTTLHWNPNPEPDLFGYRLYRGITTDFVPGPGNQIAAPPDTGHTDPAGAPYVYKLTAVDTHGNESPVATLIPSGTVGVGEAGPASGLRFEVSPNPAFATASLSFALPRAGQVRLAVYDAAGRLVRELANGPREAGAGSAVWDLRDGSGRAAGPGLYFARLEAGGFSRVLRVAITR